MTLQVPPPPDTALKGLTLGGLRKMEATVRQLCLDGHFNTLRTFPDGTVCPPVSRFEDLTTTHVVYCWVKDTAVTGDRRLADCPDLVDPADVGVPNYFISHAWKATFAKLVKTVFDFLCNASESTRVWIDCVVSDELCCQCYWRDKP